MLLATQLERVFTLKDKGQDIRLTDPEPRWSVESEQEDNTPSCSLAEALEHQDLFINSSLTQMGCSLLWNLFRKGMTEYKGFFHNLKDFLHILDKSRLKA